MWTPRTRFSQPLPYQQLPAKLLSVKSVETILP